jgi:regulator of protease activity HflC (stomatin/prohibitin superfamily)
MKIVIAFGVACLMAFVCLVASCTTIESGTIGIQRTFGQVHAEPLEPGLHFVKPFIDSVTELDTRLKSFEVAATAASKDLQVVSTVISVQHSLNAAIAPQSYAAIGDLDKFDISIVAPAVLESLKAVTAQYTAEELITQRAVVAQQISDAIQKFIDHTLAERKVSGALNVANVAIKNFDFSAEFNDSIEAKVRAQQEALRAENEKEKRMTEADAKAYEVETAAKADAFQIEQKSTAQAAAIEREAKALAQNPLLIQLRAIEKWSGTVPQFSGGGNVVPFVDVKQFATAAQ